MVHLITEHMDIWTAAQTPKINGGRGRGKNSNGQSPHGVKKLRELILELAVRGKLVPQDSNDEPASVLLEKIAEEKVRLVKEGKIKKQKPLPPISPDETPYNTPQSWEWVRLGEFGDWGAGATPNRKNPAYYGGNMPWLKSGELRDNERLSSSEETVTNKALEQCSLRVCQPGDVLIAMYGATIGMLAILENVATTNQAVCACTCHSGVFNRYLFLMLRAWRPKFTGQGAGGAQPNISKVKIINTIAPLPPLTEQHRIVAKVDELMALCDRLEQQQTGSNAIHQALVETLLTTITHAVDQDASAEAWKRIDNHFDTLFTTEQSIDQLKQTILQLAVMGKLVQQDPNDEPASVLLEKIAKKKARLIKEGKIKKQKPLPEISDDEKPFELPQGWEWVKLGNIASFENGDRSSRYPKEHDLQPSGIPFFGAKDMVDGELSFDNNLRFISEDKFKKLSNGKLYDLDFVILLRGTVGKIAIYRANSKHSTGFINAQMIIVRMIDKELCNFFGRYSSSVFYQSAVAFKTTGSAVRQMPGNALSDFLIPLPPLSEQHRIVPKVDELIALCDNLKTRLNDAQTTQIQLADVIVEQAVA